MWKKRQCQIMLLGVFALNLAVGHAEEQPSSVLTSLSGTTISGHVNVSAHWAVRPQSAVRFFEICQLLQQKGFQMRVSDGVYSFRRFWSGERIAFVRAGAFATEHQLQKLQDFLARNNLR